MCEGRGCACVRVEGLWEISVPSFEWYCKPKIALNKFFKKR